MRGVRGGWVGGWRRRVLKGGGGGGWVGRRAVNFENALNGELSIFSS